MKQKKIPHACTSHVMKDVKKSCKKYYTGNMEYGLYSFSTLLNTDTLEGAKQALFDLAVILQGRKLTREVQEASERMQKRFKALSKQTVHDAKQDVYESTKEAKVDEAATKSNKTEEEFLHLAQGTCFTRWAKRMIECAKLTVKQEDNTVENNGRYGPTFLEDIQKLLLQTLPLWSGIMLGDLKRHGRSAPYHRYTFSSGIRERTKTTGAQEGRFNQLKTLILQGKTRNRVDVFSKKLKESTKALQTLALKNALKKTKRAWGKKTVLVEETWDKKRREPDQMRDKKYGKLRGQYFENGQWHEPFIKGMKASNPYCVLMIKRHHVSLAEERKLSECKALLTADLYRKLKDCPITAKLTMNQKFTATVTYSHDVVMHHIGEQDARPIRGTERET